MVNLEQLKQELERALLLLDRVAVRRIIMESGNSFTPLQMVENVMVPVLQSIGDGWDQGRVAMSQLYMGGRICEELVDQIVPQRSSESSSRMAIVVLEDYHMLGKRIIYSALSASGFRLLDYGRMGVEELVERVKAERLQYLLISTLMLPSALRVKDVRSMLDEAHPDTKIVVGGAPFRLDGQLWREVGAYASGNNSAEAIEIISRLVKGGA